MALTPAAVKRLERLWREQERIGDLPLAERDYRALAQALAMRGVPQWRQILADQRDRITTAKLFEAAAQLGAIVGHASREVEEGLARDGMHLGTAFQLIDDALDYSSDSQTLGKNVGDDLAEGKPTLPLLYALRTGNASQQQMIRAAIEQGGLERIGEVLAAIESTGANAYNARRAEDEAGRAIQALAVIPESPYKQHCSISPVFPFIARIKPFGV